MIRLLKTDLRRIIKDKLFLISCIIALVFAFVSPLLYKGMFALLGVEDDMLAMMGALPTAKSMLFQAFLPGGDLGLILPILIIIALCKDFSYGTIRNKIIAGYSRASIFASMLITSFIVMGGLMLAYALLTFGISLALFEYSTVAFSVSEIGYLLLSILFELIVYAALCSIMCFFCVFMKNAGTSTVMYVAVNFLSTIIGSIFMIAYPLANPEKKLTYGLLEFFAKTNIFTSTAIGSGTSYSLSDVLYIVLPCLVITSLAVLLGMVVFKKKDLK